MIRAILFDLDGTLINTTELILRCFEHSWEQVCGRTQPKAAVLSTFGMPLADAMRRLAERPSAISEGGAEEEYGEILISRLIDEYRSFNRGNHDRMACRFDQVGETLEELRSRPYQLGVVTSKGRELAGHGLRLCSLDGLIDEAVFLEDTVRHKPHPDPIFAAMERMKVSARETVYVGDSPNDMAAGRAAGVTTVAALWGPIPRADLELEGPDHLAESPSDLLRLF